MRTTPIKIDPESPFANCKLNREQYANVLTSIVGAYDKGFVLAVNGKWGTGKTTFMNMWKRSLEIQGYKTIYFNAWETDFTSEPAIALLGEIKSLLDTDTIDDSLKGAIESSWEKVKDSYKSQTPQSVLKAIGRMVGAGNMVDGAEELISAASKFYDSEIDNYNSNQKELKSFKINLEHFVKIYCGDKPLIFIVDELDRCRPDYAVEVLEKIKHLFAVKGVVFVLSIDKEQLSHAVCGYYGSEKIDSREYLRRFIDLEYTIPEPDYNSFVKYLYHYYNFADFFEQELRRNSGSLRLDTSSFFAMVSTYCKGKGVSLRQLEKVFVHAKIVSMEFQNNSYADLNIVFALIFIKEFAPDIYQSIKTKYYTLELLATSLDSEFGQFATVKNRADAYYIFEWIIASIIRFYCIQHSIDPQIKEIDGVQQFSVELQYADPKRIAELINIGGQENQLYIQYYTSKIDLLETLQS